MLNTFFYLTEYNAADVEDPNENKDHIELEVMVKKDDVPAREEPEDVEEHDTTNEDQEETDHIVKYTSHQADPDPCTTHSKIVPSGSNETSGEKSGDTYPTSPNRQLTDTTAEDLTLNLNIARPSLSQLQSNGGGITSYEFK